jgi:hypothetical protein
MNERTRNLYSTIMSRHVTRRARIADWPDVISSDYWRDIRWKLFSRTDRTVILVHNHRIDLRCGQPIPPHSASMIRRPEILAQLQVELATQVNVSLGERKRALGRRVRCCFHEIVRDGTQDCIPDALHESAVSQSRARVGINPPFTQSIDCILLLLVLFYPRLGDTRAPGRVVLNLSGDHA